MIHAEEQGSYSLRAPAFYLFGVSFHGNNILLLLFRGLQYVERNRKGDMPMVVLRCPCQEKHKIWGELW